MIKTCFQRPNNSYFINELLIETEVSKKITNLDKETNEVTFFNKRYEVDRII